MTTLMIPLQPIYQRGPRVRVANAQVSEAEEEIVATRQRVGLAVVGAFYRVAAAQVRVDVARDLTRWLDTVVTYNRARVTEGVAAEADLIRAEVERDRSVAETAMREADLARNRADLTALVDSGRPSHALAVIVPDRPLDLPPGAQPLDDQSMAALLVARPDVRVASRRVEAMRAGVSVERSMLFRELGAMIGTKQMLGGTSIIAGLSVPLPILDRNRGGIARARADRAVEENELQSTERTARAEVDGALAAAQLLTQQTVAFHDGLPSSYLRRADEARRIALGAYREGAVPLLQVIDAARAWGDARTTYFDLLFAQHEAVLMLYAAQGLDLRAAAPASAPAPPPEATR